MRLWLMRLWLMRLWLVRLWLMRLWLMRRWLLHLPSASAAPSQGPQRGPRLLRPLPRTEAAKPLLCADIGAELAQTTGSPKQLGGATPTQTFSAPAWRSQQNKLNLRQEKGCEH